MSEPLVSVIIPNYRHARFLPRRIDSVLQQTFTDFEVLFLDDASPDNSREVFARYANKPRVRSIFNETNSGSTFKQWQKGIAATSGKYIWLAESDDFADVHFLERLVPMLENNPAVAIGYCQSWDTDENDRPRRILPSYVDYPNPQRWLRDFVTSGRSEIAHYFYWGCVIQNASSALIRRSAYEAAGGVDPSFKLAGDWNLYVRLLLQGDLAYCADALNYFRTHAATVRSSSKRAGIEIAETYDIVGLIEQSVPILAADQRKRRKQLAWFQASTRLAGGVEEHYADIDQRASKVDPRHRLRRVIAGLDIRARNAARSVRDRLRDGGQSNNADVTPQPAASAIAQNAAAADAPTFSVIIPVYNRVDRVHRAIESVLAQSYRDFELLVIDDGSTDNTPAAVRAFGNAVRLIEQPNGGPGAARNAGIAAARGRYCAFLDSDDRWFTWTLDTYANVIAQANATFIAGQQLAVQDTGDWFYEPLPGEFVIRLSADFYAAPQNPLIDFTTSSVVIRTDAVRAAGGFPPGRMIFEDFSLWFSLGVAEGFAWIQSPLCVARTIHDGNLIHAKDYVLRGALYMIDREKTGGYPGGSARLKQRRDRLAGILRSQSWQFLRSGAAGPAFQLYRALFGWNVRALRYKYLLGFPITAVRQSFRSQKN